VVFRLFLCTDLYLSLVIDLSNQMLLYRQIRHIISFTAGNPARGKCQVVFFDTLCFFCVLYNNISWESA
jgi:hypothetical protein